MKICDGMSTMAETYPNDQVANALARVSRKIESFGSTKFAPKLDDKDIAVIRFYLSQTQKGVVS